MTLEHVELHEGHPGSVFFRCTIPEHTKNAFNVCHGGALTTYVDIATTAALYAFDDTDRANVSAKLDMEFMNACQLGQDVYIEAKINKIGKQLAFTQGIISDFKTK